MKILTSMITTGLLIASANTQALEYKFVATDNSPATRACLSAASDDLSELKKTVNRSFNSNADLMSLTILCNDQDINAFAHAYGAVETGNYLNRVVPRKMRIDDSVEIIDVGAYVPDVNGVVTIYVGGK